MAVTEAKDVHITLYQVKEGWRVAMPIYCCPRLVLMYRSRVSFQFWPRLFSELGVQCSSLSRRFDQATWIQVSEGRAGS